MCAEYEIRKNERSIEESLQLELEGGDFPYRNRVKLFGAAPVLTGVDGAIQMREMQFSLKPAFCKYSTFNARLLNFDESRNTVTRIFEKPTWRQPFQKSRCLIPMDGFIEPIYHGEHAGEMVEFLDRNDGLLLAAGLWAKSTDPKEGRDYVGFSIIMHTPDAKVQKVGHHRTPLFLPRAAAENWLMGDISQEERFEYLLKQRQALDLLVRCERKMAHGWEKRIAQVESKFAAEKNSEAMIESWLKKDR